MTIERYNYLIERINAPEKKFAEGKTFDELKREIVGLYYKGNIPEENEDRFNYIRKMVENHVKDEINDRRIMLRNRAERIYKNKDLSEKDSIQAITNQLRDFENSLKRQYNEKYDQEIKINRRIHIILDEIEEIDKKRLEFQNKVSNQKEKSKLALSECYKKEVTILDKKNALAKFLGKTSANEIDFDYEIFIVKGENKGYYVLTDSEATEKALEMLKDFIEEDYLSTCEMPKFLRNFFDIDACCKYLLESDGRAHTISRYDEEEIIIKYKGIVLFAYRDY